MEDTKEGYSPRCEEKVYEQKVGDQIKRLKYYVEDVKSPSDTFHDHIQWVKDAQGWRDGGGVLGILLKEGEIFWSDEIKSHSSLCEAGRKTIEEAVARFEITKNPKTKIDKINVVSLTHEGAAALSRYLLKANPPGEAHLQVYIQNDFYAPTYVGRKLFDNTVMGIKIGTAAARAIKGIK